jgi:gamma-glutamyltranspeptidase/glutathione hydrolase
MVNSNYEGFGSGIVPESCGFTLQNRGSNFSLEPGHFNVYAPKKRPYHTIIPAMCVIPMSKGPDRLFCSLTNMGGFMQPQGHLQILSNILDYNMSPQEALDAPRFCISDGEGACSFEEGMSPDVVEELKTMGHNVASAIVVSHERSLFGRAQIIMKNPLTGVLGAASDGRGDGYACGY